MKLYLNGKIRWFCETIDFILDDKNKKLFTDDENYNYCVIVNNNHNEFILKRIEKNCYDEHCVTLVTNKNGNILIKNVTEIINGENLKDEELIIEKCYEDDSVNYEIISEKENDYECWSEITDSIITNIYKLTNEKWDCVKLNKKNLTYK